MYTKEEVSAAVRLLTEDSGLVEKLNAYVASVDLNKPIEKTARFHEQVAGIPVSIGSLLIAAAQQDIIDFGNAHLCLKTELLYLGQEPPLTEDAAVEEAYQILNAHGAITIERLERVKRKNIQFTNELRAVDRAFKEAVPPLPNRGRIIDFYEARARLKRGLKAQSL